MRRAVELSSADPDSGEHAEALAQLSESLWWDGRTLEARRLIENAVAVAHRSGSASAICRVHGARSLQSLDIDLEQADRDSEVCWQHALASGDPEAIAGAYGAKLNLFHAQGDQRRLLEHARDNYAWSARQGLIMSPAAMLALVLLAVGDLSEARGVVRAGLAASGITTAEVKIRLHAATLAVRRGANGAARDHLLRARELLPDLEERPWVMAGAPLAEVLLAQHDPVGAFDLVERVLPDNAVDLRVVDELMVWGARAAADLVERASDDRDQTAVATHRKALTRLVNKRATLPGIGFQPSGPGDTTQVARAALFGAESGRAAGVEDQISLWREAVAACAEAGLGWERQVSSWRLARALIESGASGSEAAALLRGIHEYAVQHRATPLQTHVEELAASARISLTSPSALPAAAVPAAFSGLTPRETQVLAHLMANRTNAEIAQTLCISEKTVSVHVSNLLRKTASGSRREVAALARRVGWGTGG
jgi:DNA-binding CsgD family transcriptional regulator